MGLTYYAKGKRSSFDVNVSGVQVLGYLMKAVDEHSKSIEERDRKYYAEEDIIPSARYVTNGKDCANAAKKLSVLTDEQYEEVWKRCKYLWDKTSTIEEFKSWVKTWIAFLKKCNKGYDTNG